MSNKKYATRIVIVVAENDVNAGWITEGLSEEGNHVLDSYTERIKMTKDMREQYKEMTEEGEGEQG